MTASHKPVNKPDPMYQLLREGKVVQFNALKAQGTSCDLRGSDLRGLDLRGLDAQGLDLGDSYLRQSDLRGIDFSTSNLAGASISGAKISGAYFPAELDAEEITLSLLHGTRMRYRRKPAPSAASEDS